MLNAKQQKPLNLMEIEILNIRLPTEIVQWLDSLVKRGVYHSRAEAIRDFCRQHVNESSDSFKVQKNE